MQKCCMYSRFCKQFLDHLAEANNAELLNLITEAIVMKEFEESRRKKSMFQALHDFEILISTIYIKK